MVKNKLSILLTEYELLMLLLCPSTLGRSVTLLGPDIVVYLKWLSIKNPLDVFLVDLSLLSVFTQTVKLGCHLGVVYGLRNLHSVHV